MVTENQADVWLGQQVGQHLDYDQQYGQQCFDFFNYYYQYISGRGPYGDGYGVLGAKDIWDVPTVLFDKIPDSRTLVPNVGDALIYGSTWGGGYGHVEVCRWSDDNGCHVIGENEHGNPSEGVVEVYRSWAGMRGLIGVMRPRFSPDPTPPQEVPSEPTQTPEPVPTEPSEPKAPTPADASPDEADTQPLPTQADTPTQDTNQAPEPTPPKVVVPEPTYFNLWELIKAILQKIFKKK
jgi:hypothetical protein